MRSAEEQLLAFFPMMSIKKYKEAGQFRDTIVLDCFEFVIPSSSVLHMLLNRCSDVSSNEPYDKAVTAAFPVVAGAAEKPGRKSHHIRFPSGAQKAIDYLQQHGWSSQERRRTDDACSVGVSLSSLRQHLLDNVPGLKTAGISLTTVHCSHLESQPSMPTDTKVLFMLEFLASKIQHRPMFTRMSSTVRPK